MSVNATASTSNAQPTTESPVKKGTARADVAIKIIFALGLVLMTAGAICFARHFLPKAATIPMIVVGTLATLPFFSRYCHCRCHFSSRSGVSISGGPVIGGIQVLDGVANPIVVGNGKIVTETFQLADVGVSRISGSTFLAEAD